MAKNITLDSLHLCSKTFLLASAFLSALILSGEGFAAQKAGDTPHHQAHPYHLQQLPIPPASAKLDSSTNESLAESSTGVMAAVTPLSATRPVEVRAASSVRLGLAIDSFIDWPVGQCAKLVSNESTDDIRALLEVCQKAEYRLSALWIYLDLMRHSGREKLADATDNIRRYGYYLDRAVNWQTSPLNSHLFDNRMKEVIDGNQRMLIEAWQAFDEADSKKEFTALRTDYETARAELIKALDALQKSSTATQQPAAPAATASAATSSAAQQKQEK